MPILKDRTACYECKPKPTPKVYPICTIRSTPDKPVHCIVWAKELFILLFGVTHESKLYEDTQATGETSTYMHLLTPPVTPFTISSFLTYCSDLLLALFHTEINKRIGMDIYKTAVIQPVPLPTNLVDEACLVEQVIHCNA